MDDLSARKYHFIEELLSIEDANVMEALEEVLKQKKLESPSISVDQKKELDERLKKYSENPDDLLDWKEVKANW